MVSEDIISLGSVHIPHALPDDLEVDHLVDRALVDLRVEISLAISSFLLAAKGDLVHLVVGILRRHR